MNERFDPKVSGVYKTDRIELSVGPAFFSIPSRMTRDERNDLKEFVSIVLRKLERWNTPPLTAEQVAGFLNESIESPVAVRGGEGMK